MPRSCPDTPSGTRRHSLSTHIALAAALACGVTGCGTPREAAVAPARAMPAATAAPAAAPQSGAPTITHATARTATAEAVAAAAAADPEVPTLAELVVEARARYGATWYRTLSFTQTTTFHGADGTTRSETWHEAGQIPGFLRIDLPELGAGNVYVFRGDSTYAFRAGTLAAAQPEGNPLMLLGFDLYHIPVAETVAGIAALGVDTARVRAAVWNGRPAWVFGAAEGDEASPQVWFDQERLVFLRLVERGGPARDHVQDIRFERYEPLGGGWIAPRVEMYVDGRLVMTEDYADVRANPTFPPGTFSPTPAGVAVRWWE